MKINCLLIAIALRLTCNTVSAQIAADKVMDHYVQNSDLPYDQVTDAWIEKPKQRPANEPANYALVQVCWSMPYGYKLLGWQYLDANFVNWLHQGPRI